MGLGLKAALGHADAGGQLVAAQMSALSAQLHPAFATECGIPVNM